MKNVFGLVGAGFLSLAALQGCAAATGDDSEQIGKASQAATACYSNSGLNPTKAALAVAMADELGRWVPSDLVRSGGVSLSSSAVCLKNNCGNTKALLGLQDDQVSQFVDQNVFNPAVYRNDLIAAMDRTSNMMGDLARNNPGSLPPAHKLTKVG